MQLGLIGLGKMGGNMAERLRLGGHQVVGFDFNAEAVQKLTASGNVGASSLEEMAKKLQGRTSKTNSVAKAGTTSPSHRSGPARAPRSRVCGPETCTTQEIAVAITNEASSAAPYCSAGLMPVCAIDSRVRPMPLSHA